MSKDVKVVQIGRVKVKLPPGARIVESVDLDVLYEELGMGHGRKSDVLLILEYRNRKYAVVVEDTGRPERKDFERLRETLERLGRMNIVGGDVVVVKVLHHGGVGKGKSLFVSMARSYKVEVQECRRRFVDLDLVFRRRFR